MTPFEQIRLQFQPTLPHLLRRLNGLELVPHETAPPPFPIQSHLPHTATQPLLEFKAVSPAYRGAMRVGVVLSGGQAPGGHNVITGLFDALQSLNEDSLLLGFLGGPAGILKAEYRQLTQEELAPYRNTGGFDLIGSGRTKIETAEQFADALKTCLELELDGLVIIGGDDSNTNAALLAEYFTSNQCSTCVIGVPKTIDGDLKNAYVETSFGFDSACKVYSEMIGNICRDALSAKKYTHFIKLMGRSASHIALECALQTHPNITLISEEIADQKLSFEQVVEGICDVIAKRSSGGRDYGVILIPEGLIEFIPEMKLLIKELNTLQAQGVTDPASHLSEPSAATFTYLPKEVAQQLLLDRDPHGNVQLSHIATEQLLIQAVRARLKTWPGYTGKFNPIGHFLGYEGRCGYPSNFDATYCYALGFTAAALLADGATGYMTALQHLEQPAENWIPIGVPLALLMDLEDRKGAKKPVIKKALVDLSGAPFQAFSTARETFALTDAYVYPPPTQFFGPPALCDLPPLTVLLESSDHPKI